MSAIDNILNNDKMPISQAQLEQYAKGELTPAEAYEVELHLSEAAEFENEAIEGLQENNTNVAIALHNINKKIDQKLKDSNKQKRHRQNKQGEINMMAIWLILGLVVVGYIVIRMMVKK